MCCERNRRGRVVVVVVVAKRCSRRWQVLVQMADGPLMTDRPAVIGPEITEEDPCCVKPWPAEDSR
jgi:hypothetical protein